MPDERHAEQVAHVHVIEVDSGDLPGFHLIPVVSGAAAEDLHALGALHPTVLQGKTISGSYHDGDRSFTLKDSNSYFTPKMKKSGKI